MRFFRFVKSKYSSTATTKKSVTASYADETFELTDELKETLKKLGILEDVIPLKDGEAKLTPKAAKELDRTYKVFTSEEYADKNFQEVETVLKEETEAVVKKVAGKKAKDFDVDVTLHIQDRYVVGEGAAAVVEISYKDDSEEIDSVYYKGGDEISDAITSWPEWAFWLLDDDSPLQSSDFRDAYERDRIGHALTELLSYKEEIDALKKKAEEAVKDLMARNDD